MKIRKYLSNGVINLILSMPMIMTTNLYFSGSTINYQDSDLESCKEKILCMDVKVNIVFPFKGERGEGPEK